MITTKRDLKLNMGQLAETLQHISDYRAKLQTLREAFETFKKILDSQISEGCRLLSGEIQDDIIVQIGEMETRMEILHTLLSGYITDMKGYVAPEIEGQMMRVDRNDIWYNMMQIEGEVENASYGFNPPYHSEPDYQYVYIDEESDAAEAIRNEIEAERGRRERNYNKLEGFRNDSIGAGYQPFADALDAMWRIYNESIKEFENKDDDYAKQVDRHYDEWGAGWAKRQDFWRGAGDIVRGVWDAVVGMLDGIWSLALYLEMKWSLPGLLLQSLPLELPDYITDRVDGMEAGFSLMLSDPWAAVEAMGQGLMDTYDEEGICYAVGNAIPDIVLEIVATKGAGTLLQGTARTADIAEDMADVARAANMVDNITDAAHAANMVDNITDVAHAADGFGDMAGFADKTSDVIHALDKVEDVFDDLDDLGRFYDDIFDAQKEINDLYEDYLEQIRKLMDDVDGSAEDAVRAAQRSVIESVENSAEGTKGLTSIQKGNYGEIKTDIYYEGIGYERVSLDTVTGLNQSTHHGIDGVYYNPDGHPPYIIAETKYGSSRLGNTLDGRQMSDTWISNRLVDAVGETRANEIMRQMVEGNVQSQLVRVSAEGNISVKLLDSEAKVIKNL